MSFDPAFRFYSEDPQHRVAPTVSEQYAEALAEIAARQRLYPRRVETGRMTADEAAFQTGVMQAIADELRPRMTVERITPAGRYSWTDMVHVLRREIALRRRFYPDWIAAGRIDAAEAARKLETLEGLHEHMWKGWWHLEAIAARAATEAMAA